MGVIIGRIMITGATKVGGRTESADPSMWSPLLTSRRNLANLGDSKTWRIYPTHGTRILLTRQASARTSRIILKRTTRPRARVRKTITTRIRRIKETRGFRNPRVLSTLSLLESRVLRASSKKNSPYGVSWRLNPLPPKYLNWSKYPIQFSHKDQWTSVDNVEHYLLVIDPTIAGMTVTKVLIDGGAWLNIIFFDTLRKIHLDFAGLLTLTDVPFYGIVLDKAAMPFGRLRS
jgi:hypothetical protein